MTPEPQSGRKPGGAPARSAAARPQPRSFAMADQLDALVAEVSRRDYPTRRALKADLREQALELIGEL